MHRDSSPVYEALKIDGSQIKDHFGHPISPKVWSIVSDLSRDVDSPFFSPSANLWWSRATRGMKWSFFVWPSGPMIQWLVNDPHVIHFSHLESTWLLVKHVRFWHPWYFLLVKNSLPHFSSKKKDMTVDWCWLSWLQQFVFAHPIILFWLHVEFIVSTHIFCRFYQSRKM